MTGINPYLDGGAFSPEILQAMATAFERALAQLRDSGQSDVVKEVLAKRIIDLARHGETDPTRLCDGALKALPRASGAFPGRRPGV